MGNSLKNKDRQIIRIVDYLLHKYNKKIIIKDFWDADLCSVGVCDKDERFLIYISTFELPINRFNIVLENLLDNEDNPVNAGEFNDITIDELEKKVIEHLKIY